MKRLLLSLTIVALVGCSGRGVNWRSYSTSEVAEVQREIMGKFHIVVDKVELNDCTICFSSPHLYSRACARIDMTGLVHKAIEHDFAWLKQIECRREGGKKVFHEWAFPYWASDVSVPNRVHYLGDITIDLTNLDNPAVRVEDHLDYTLNDFETRGRTFKLKVRKALLKVQDNTWGQSQEVKD